MSASQRLPLLADMPVMVAWGSKDKIIPPHHHRALALQLPQARAVEIEGAGHFVHETAASTLVPHIQSFLASTAPFQYTEARWRALLDARPGQAAS